MRVTPTSGYKVPVATKNKLNFGSDGRAEHHRLSHIMNNFRPGMGISPPAPVQSTPTSIPQPNTTADHFSTTVAASAPEQWAAIQALAGMRRGTIQQMETDEIASSAPHIIEWTPINGRHSLPTVRNPFAIDETPSGVDVSAPIVSSPTVMSRRATLEESTVSAPVGKPKGRRSKNKAADAGAVVRPANQGMESKSGFTDVNASPFAPTPEDTAKPSKKVAPKRAGKSTTAMPPSPIVAAPAKKTKRTGAAKHTSGVDAAASQETPRLTKAQSPLKQSPAVDVDSDEEDFQPIAPSRRGTNNSRVIYTSSTDEAELDAKTPKPVHKPYAQLERHERKDIDNLVDACEDGKLGAVKRALKKNRNLLNQENKDGYTPLRAAAAWNQFGVVKFLLSRNGIQPDLQDEHKGYSAAMLPNEKKPNYLATLLVFVEHAEAHPGSINFTTLKNGKGKSALDFANQYAMEIALERNKKKVAEREILEGIRERMFLTESR